MGMGRRTKIIKGYETDKTGGDVDRNGTLQWGWGRDDGSGNENKWWGWVAYKIFYRIIL